jgi:hypothetical protein
MADSFDDTLEALLIVKEGNSVFAIGEDFEKASRWARYAFEAGRASARRQKKAVKIKDELSKAELPGYTPADIDPMHNQPMIPTPIEHLTQDELDTLFNPGHSLQEELEAMANVSEGHAPEWSNDQPT